MTSGSSTPVLRCTAPTGSGGAEVIHDRSDEKERKLMRKMGNETALGSAKGAIWGLVIAGAISWITLEWNTRHIERLIEATERELNEEQIRRHLETEARVKTEEIERRITEEVHAALRHTREPQVRESALENTARNKAEGLAEKPIEDIERIGKSIYEERRRPDLERKLKEWVREDDGIAEIFFTDRDGFNVAVSNPTSDFVQSDEKWWQGAWSHRVEIGGIGYDESAGLWSIDVAVRIESEEGEPIGVMKTVIDLAAIQTIADEMSERTVGGRAYVAEQQGTLVAETSSGHAQTRVGNTDIEIQKEQTSTKTAFAGQRNGNGQDSEWITGFARTKSESGVDWITIVQQPRISATGSVDRLGSITKKTQHTAVIALACVIAGGIIVIGSGCAGAQRQGKRTAHDIEGMIEMVKANTEGDWTGATTMSGPVELHELNQGIGRIAKVLRKIARELVRVKKTREKE